MHVSGVCGCVHAGTYQCTYQVRGVTWTGRDSEADRRKWKDERRMRLGKKKKKNLSGGASTVLGFSPWGERAGGVEGREGLSGVCG